MYIPIVTFCAKNILNTDKKCDGSLVKYMMHDQQTSRPSVLCISHYNTNFILNAVFFNII